MDRSIVFHCRSSKAKKALAEVLRGRGEAVCPFMSGGEMLFPYVGWAVSEWGSAGSSSNIYFEGRTVVEVG